MKHPTRVKNGQGSDDPSVINTAVSDDTAQSVNKPPLRTVNGGLFDLKTDILMY